MQDQEQALDSVTPEITGRLWEHALWALLAVGEGQWISSYYKRQLTAPN